MLVIDIMKQATVYVDKWGAGTTKFTEVFESTVPLAPAKRPAPTLKCIFEKRANGAFSHLLLAEYFARHWLNRFSPLWPQAVPESREHLRRDD